MKINQEFEINATAHSKRVVEVSTVYNNQFIRQIYFGCTVDKAKEKFANALRKGA